ncbi:MAG TPA: glucans biosynthesis glucosyltransferase MdoH [Roseiarcus sp.]
MLDRSGAPVVKAPRRTLALSRRRIVYFALVGCTMAGILRLATAAVPPADAGAIAFLVLFTVTLPWTVIGFWNAAIGFLLMCGARDPVESVNPMAASIRGDEPILARTAILMCVRNEAPAQVVRNLRPLVEGLSAARVADRFDLYLLSDTSDPEIVPAEEVCFSAFVASHGGELPITYRRRSVNTGFKAGNIRDFCERWGEGYDFAVTLDADSFIPAAPLLRLVRVMQANPTLGILQTLVTGMPSESGFTRLFQFGMRLGMRSYTLGSAWWQGDCGPYWGHNAILRLQPFTSHCRLPVLPSHGPLGGPILSHDQVEAALMRRAGYEVRVLPVEGTSWEENPPTLLEYLRRDLRWCHGNMQYWRLLGLPGLKLVSRFQLVLAILMYVGSPAWMAMIALGGGELALAKAPAEPVDHAGGGAGGALLGIMLLMIFAPKTASGIDILLRRESRRAYGGAGLLLANLGAEFVFSLLLSPIMALSQTMFLVRLLAFRRGGAWSSQVRETHAVPWSLAWRQLWPHTFVGFALLSLAAVARPGAIGLALLAAAGLALSVPFAVTTAEPLFGALLSRRGIGRIPEETAPTPTLALSDFETEAT